MTGVVSSRIDVSQCQNLWFKEIIWNNWHCKFPQFVFLGHSYIFCFARKDFMLVTLAH